MSGIVAGSVVGGSFVSGYLGAKGAKDAAKIQAGASAEATAEQRRQYDLTRQDMAPWMTAAVGEIREPTYAERQQAGTLVRQQYGGAAYDRLPMSEKDRLVNEQLALTEGSRREGGALQEYAGYGRSKVSEGEYIPASDIPEFEQYTQNLPQIRSDIPQFNVGGEVSRFTDRGNVPEFTGAELDVYKDPGYEFRLGEMQRQVDRGAAGMGKVMSGARAEELMKRGGEMASQEYGNMWGRALQDYERQRGRESEMYGRDVGIYGMGRDVEQELYGRDLTAWEAGMKREAQRYGRDVDQYSRELGLAEDLYRARAGEEALGYGRGVDAYGRAYGTEADYLNRLGSISKVGQQTATQMGAYGQQTAANIGQNIKAAGDVRAAGRIGEASAWQGMIGDLTSLATRYQPARVTTQYGPMTGRDIY